MEEEEDDEVEEEDRPQDREAHFVRGCGGDVQMNISQEPFCVEFVKGNCRTRMRTRRLKTGP